MDFSFKKQTSRRAPSVKTLAAASMLSLIVLVSGCTSQTAKTDGAKSTALLSAPVVDERLSSQDFGFPSQPPSLMRGREIFNQSCASCHAKAYWQGQKVKEDLAYTTPIDLYLMLTTGQAPQVVMPNAQRRQLLPQAHNAFKDKLSRDDRWAVIFYARYLAGAGDIKSPDPKADIAAIFGGNCAVCHGQKGQADGPLFTAKTGNHELHDGSQLRNFMPPPANFTQYNRVYNRTDAQLFKYICEGIYPSAMPAWYGDVNVDKDTGKATYVFDEKLIMNLVRHVRTLAYKNDLTPELEESKVVPSGLQFVQSCQPAPTNRPWTQSMREFGPSQAQGYQAPAGDPITGGMVHVSPHSTVPVIHSDKGVNQSAMEGRNAE